MTIGESVELRDIRTRVKKNHATRADLARAHEILADDPSAIERFDALVAEKALSEKAADRTSASRKARQRERENAFEIPLEPGDSAVRESCRGDLVRFGVIYCTSMLNHAPSDMMVRTLIRPLQNAIMNGGLNVVEFPRGTGKTTWMKIAMLWAVLYGYKRFIMTVAATRDHAKAINEQILYVFEMSEELKRDFPALALPIVALGGNWRKASTQKFEDRPTRIVNSDGYIVLPTIYKTGTDEVRETAAGAVFYTAGIHGAIRGISRAKQRPDMIFFDDPQTREEAESVQSSDKLERLIEGDALGNFGQADVRSCIMAITPIRPGDIASRFSDRSLHAAWGSSKVPYVLRFADGFDDLFAVYRQCYADDVAAQKAVIDNGGTVAPETAWASSTRFYLDHRDDFAGTEVLDPNNFNRYEIDAIHHVLNVKASYRDQSLFDAELQMDVTGEIDGTVLTPDEVSAKVNGFPRDVLPPGTFDAVAFIDVNTASGAGLRWGVLAFGPNRVAAVVDYGAYPENGGALVPPKADKVLATTLVERGIKEVLKKIVTLPLRHPNGARVYPLACAIDRGYLPDPVYRAVAFVQENYRLHGMSIVTTLGRKWSQYMNFRKDDERAIVQKDHVYSGVAVSRVNGHVLTRKYLGMMSCYWREIAQKAFLKSPLEPGSCSLFGKEPSVHRDFANECTYEKLIRVYREDKKPFRQAWDWTNDNPGHNHSLDIVYGAFAVASWFGIYRAGSGLPSETAPRVKSLPKADWLTKAEAAEVAAARKARPLPPVKRIAAPSRFKIRFRKA